MIIVKIMAMVVRQIPSPQSMSTYFVYHADLAVDGGHGEGRKTSQLDGLVHDGVHGRDDIFAPATVDKEPSTPATATG